METLIGLIVCFCIFALSGIITDQKFNRGGYDIPDTKK